MAGLNSRYIRGALVFFSTTNRRRIVHAIGENVKGYVLRTPDLNITTVDPTGWEATVVEVGAGTTEFDANNAVDRIGTITTAANEDDGGQYQLIGEQFKADSSRDFYAGIKAKINDVLQTDILFGLCITDTTLLGGMTDGIYFESLDGVASISAITEKDSAETQSDSLGTLVDDTDVVLELFYDGVANKVYFYIDGVEVAAHSLTIPDDEELRPSIAFLTGEAVANNVNVAWMRFFQFS